MYIHKKYNCVDDLVDNILNGDNFGEFSIICKFDNCRMVLKSLIKYGELLPFLIEIEDPMWDGYDKEFIVSVSDNDVFCERFFRDNYIHIGDDPVYVLSDCSDQCIEHVQRELEHGQYCEQAGFSCDLSDRKDDESDSVINIDFEISMADAYNLAKLSQKIFSPYAHIIDRLLV